MMTENDVPNSAASDPEDPDAANPVAANPDAVTPDAAGKAHHPKPHEHFVSAGAESTRELREMARRRREAEEKLQQHLQEAQHGHGVKEPAQEEPAPDKPVAEKPATQEHGPERPATD